MEREWKYLVSYVASYRGESSLGSEIIVLKNKKNFKKTAIPLLLKTKIESHYSPSVKIALLNYWLVEK